MLNQKKKQKLDKKTNFIKIGATLTGKGFLEKDANVIFAITNARVEIIDLNETKNISIDFGKTQAKAKKNSCYF